MLSPVLQHVEEGRARLSRRPKLPRVVAIAPDGAFPIKAAVDGQCDANREPSYPRHQSATILGLDDCVQVICLYREGEYSEARVRCAPDRRQDRVEESDVSEGRQSGASPKRDVCRKASLVFGPASVRDRRPATCDGRSPGALASAAAGRSARQRELELFAGTPHLKRAIVCRRTSNSVARPSTDGSWEGDALRAVLARLAWRVRARMRVWPRMRMPVLGPGRLRRTRVLMRSRWLMRSRILGHMLARRSALEGVISAR